MTVSSAPHRRAACLIGWPAAHSRSPLIHHYWLRQLGIEGGYSIESVPPEGFAEFVLHLKRHGYVGANVTIPHKQTALACVDQVDPVAARIGFHEHRANRLVTAGETLAGTVEDLAGERFSHQLLGLSATEASADAVVVVAGMEGALASVVGGLTAAPVVAVPTSVGYGSGFEGVTALLAMHASCASGVTVVGIDNGFGAACAVARMCP